MRRLIAAETWKLIRLRSTLWNLLALVAVAVGFTYLVANAVAAPGGARETDPIFASLYSLTVAQLAVVTLGALASGAEYTHSTIQTSLLAMPARHRFYFAKSIAVASLVGVVSAVTVLACHGLAQAVLREKGIGFFELDAPQAMLGAWLYLVGMSLFASGVAWTVRGSSPALVTMLPILLLGSQGIDNLEALRPVAQFLPDYAGTMIFHTAGMPDDPFFPRAYGPWEGLAIFALWVLGASIAGYLSARRDV